MVRFTGVLAWLASKCTPRLRNTDAMQYPGDVAIITEWHSALD